MDKNMKILVVDDFSTMRRIVKNLLREIKPFTADTLKEKIQKVVDRVAA